MYENINNYCSFSHVVCLMINILLEKNNNHHKKNTVPLTQESMNEKNLLNLNTISTLRPSKIEENSLRLQLQGERA